MIQGHHAGFELDAERAAGFRFQDRQQGGRLAEGVHLVLFSRRQGVALITHGQVVHAGLVLLADMQIEDIAADMLGKLAVSVAKEAGEDRHLVFRGRVGGGGAHMRSFASDGYQILPHPPMLTKLPRQAGRGGRAIGERTELPERVEPGPGHEDHAIGVHRPCFSARICRISASTWSAGMTFPARMSSRQRL